MAENKKEKRGSRGVRHAKSVGRTQGNGRFAREYSYVLHITPEELAFLAPFKSALAAGSARFAEVYYNYLYDNPDIADVLYTAERRGDDAS